jgi:hypothetical protein
MRIGGALVFIQCWNTWSWRLEFCRTLTGGSVSFGYWSLVWVL